MCLDVQERSLQPCGKNKLGRQARARSQKALNSTARALTFSASPRPYVFTGFHFCCTICFKVPKIFKVGQWPNIPPF